MGPKVSVIMSVYNDSSYVQEAIDSILHQTFQDFEFIIINDGSTDNTRDILLSYQDTRLHIIDNPKNLGITTSLNKLLRLARGKYIARQDGDDISEPERLAEQVAFLEANPDVVLVGTWYREIDSRGHFLSNGQIPCNGTDLRWDLLFYCPFVHGSILFDRLKVTERTGFYNEDFRVAQDYDLWSRIAREFRVANLDQYLVRYRVNPSSITSTRKQEQDAVALTIQKTNIQCLLDIDSDRTNIDEMDPKLMTTLFLQSPNDQYLQNLSQVDHAVNHSLHLQDLFCKYYQLSFRESQDLRRKLANYLSQQLIAIADYHFIQEPYQMVPLLKKAYHLNPFSVFSWNGVRLMLKVVLGPTLVKAIQKHFLKGRVFPENGNN